MMETGELILFFLLSFIAEVLGTLGGFGSSVLFVPIAALFLDFHSVLGITAIFHLSSNASKIYLFNKGIDKKLIFRFGIPSILAVIAGALLSQFISSRYLELYLGFFLIAAAILLLVVRNKTLQKLPGMLPIGGTVSGFTAGLLGTGGAIRGLALSTLALSKEVFIATSAIIDMGIDLSRTVVYGINGYIHKEDLHLITGLIITGFVGTYAGKLLLRFVSENQFKTLVLVIIIVIGISLIIKQIS